MRVWSWQDVAVFGGVVLGSGAFVAASILLTEHIAQNPNYDFAVGSGAGVVAFFADGAFFIKFRKMLLQRMRSENQKQLYKTLGIRNVMAQQVGRAAPAGPAMLPLVQCKEQFSENLEEGPWEDYVELTGPGGEYRALLCQDEKEHTVLIVLNKDHLFRRYPLGPTQPAQWGLKYEDIGEGRVSISLLHEVPKKSGASENQ